MFSLLLFDENSMEGMCIYIVCVRVYLYIGTAAILIHLRMKEFGSLLICEVFDFSGEIVHKWGVEKASCVFRCLVC